MRSEQPICAPPHLSEVFQSCLWNNSNVRRTFKEDRLALLLSTLLSSRWSMMWCLWFVSAGSVSSSSTLQVFRGASHLWELLCPPVYLLSHFLSLRHVQGSTSTGIFKGGCRPLTHSSLGFPFHFSFFVAKLCLLNLWRWWLSHLSLHTHNANTWDINAYA